MSQKPVIFLAFANDKVDTTAYLRNLSTEMHNIRRALTPAITAGLIEIVERSSSTITDVVDVFRDPVYGSRIAIFHYGGHANGFSLLLESEDGKNTATNKEGLVPFLSKQPGLKLIFLNGCSSEAQANDLIKSGIPAVIGTTSSINDDIATKLATSFYSSMAMGSGIDKAWSDATDEVKIASGTSNTRALHWEGKADLESGRFPWVIQYKDGGEIIKSWNFADASGNPLFGLPDIPSIYNLPETPFLYLNRYERKHADVFFGRSFYIRTLYHAVSDKHAPPIILLYGNSGVGKSSLLEAGLQPRLEASYEILYARRNGALGLSGTLYDALITLAGFQKKSNEDIIAERQEAAVLDNLKNIAGSIRPDLKSEVEIIIHKLNTREDIPTNQDNQNLTTGQTPKNINEAWRFVESKLQKPLLVILDQVEEAYTRPNKAIKDELSSLFNEIEMIFGEANALPLGKIILSFRKEYYSEIDEYCKVLELPRSRMFIEHMNIPDVIDVFHGFSNTPKLQSRYNIQIESGLPEIVATDLASKDDTPIAPMLQILLTKLWLKAYAVNPQAPTFDIALYKQIKDEGLAMDEFLQNQLLSFKSKYPVLYQNGFITDVLGFYCTANNTSAAHGEQELLDRYPDATQEAQDILHQAKDLFLITDLGGDKKSAMLAHDTLALSVSKMKTQSSLPLQQAQRILFANAEASKNSEDYSLLDKWELDTIESVKKYLPAISDLDQKLIDESKKAIRKKEIEQRSIKWLRRAFVILVILGSGFVAYYYIKAHKNEMRNFVNEKAASSAMHVNSDPTLSLHEAMDGFSVDDSLSLPVAKRSLIHSFYTAIDNGRPWYKTLYQSATRNAISFYNISYDQSRKVIMPFGWSDTLFVFDEEGNLLTTCISDSVDHQFIRGWVTYDGRNIVGLDDNGKVYVFDTKGQLKDSFIYYGRTLLCPTKNILGEMDMSDDEFKLLDLQGDVLRRFSKPKNASDFEFSKDGATIFFKTNDDSRGDWVDKIIQMDTLGKILKTVRANSKYVSEIKTTPSGKLFGYADSYSFKIIGPNGKPIQLLPYLQGIVGSKDFVIDDIEFSSNDSLVYLGTNDTIAYLYNLYTHQKFKLKHELPFLVGKFSTDSKKLVTGSSDNTLKVWESDGTLDFTLMGHKGDVTDAMIANDGNHVFSVSSDGSFKYWTLQTYDPMVFTGHTNSANYVSVDPSGKYLVSSGNDYTMRIWNVRTRSEMDRVSFIGNEYNAVPNYVYFINQNLIAGILFKDGFIFNLEDRSLKYLKGHQSEITWMDHVGDTIVTVGRDGNLIIWLSNGSLYKTVAHPDHYLTGLSIAKQINHVAVSNFNGEILIYDFRGHRLDSLKLSNRPINYLSFNPDGSRLAVVAEDKSLVIDFEVNPPVEIQMDKIHCAPFLSCKYNSAYFSNDGEYIVTAASDKTVRIHNRNGDVLFNLSGHTDDIKEAFFSDNDKFIYTYSKDKTVRLWDTQGNEIAVYKHLVNVTSATLNSNSTRIFTSSEDGIIRGYFTPTGAYRWLKDHKVY